MGFPLRSTFRSWAESSVSTKICQLHKLLSERECTDCLYQWWEIPFELYPWDCTWLWHFCRPGSRMGCYVTLLESSRDLDWVVRHSWQGLSEREEFNTQTAPKFWDNCHVGIPIKQWMGLIFLTFGSFSFSFRSARHETSTAIVVMEHLSIEVVATGTSVKLILSWHISTTNVVN